MVLGHQINECLGALSEWMSMNFLKLNKEKTKILVAGPPALLKLIDIHGTFIDGECIRFVDNAKI